MAQSTTSTEVAILPETPAEIAQQIQDEVAEMLNDAGVQVGAMDRKALFGVGGGMLAVYGSEGSLWQGQLHRRGEESFSFGEESGEIVGGHQSAADIGIEDGEYLDVKHSSSSETFQFCFKTRESVVTDDADGENFDEYMGLILEDKSTARDGRALSHAMKRWPRIRKYWPRVRRRICSACGKHTLDLSQPRYLVCGGCGKGRGVGRYCSETCQAEHWPVHSMNCAYILGPAP